MMHILKTNPANRVIFARVIGEETNSYYIFTEAKLKEMPVKVVKQYEEMVSRGDGFIETLDGSITLCIVNDRSKEVQND